MAGSMSVSPYLVVSDARAALAFYAAAFGAETGDALIDPGDGRIGHAEFRLGDTTLMIADEYPDFGALSPDTLGGSPIRLELNVPDVDAVFARAVSLGAVEQRPVKDQFHGHRSGTLIDPFGHIWLVTSPTAPISTSEAQSRWDAMAQD